MANRRQSGFTLIELLVVMSIIALLVAILLPGLAKARAAAVRVICSSQLRQVGLGHSMYAEAHGAWYPVANWATQATFGLDQSYNAGSGKFSALAWYGGSSQGLVCPSHEYLGTIAGYEAGKELTVNSMNMIQSSYRFVAVRGTHGYNQFYGYSAGDPSSFTFFGIHQGSGLPYRDDNRISPVIPNREFAGRVVTDPRSGRTHYLHPPDMMPMAMDGRDQKLPTWVPYAAGGTHANNHQGQEGMNIHYLDGHGVWANQSEGENRVTLYSTNGTVKW